MTYEAILCEVARLQGIDEAVRINYTMYEAQVITLGRYQSAAAALARL